MEKINFRIIIFILFFIIIFSFFFVALQKNNMQIFGFNINIVLTNSMTGEIEKGDLIISKKINMNNLKINDNIVLFDNVLKSNIVHKILKIEYQNDYKKIYENDFQIEYLNQQKKQTINQQKNSMMFDFFKNDYYFDSNKFNFFQNKNNNKNTQDNIIITTCAIYPEIKTDTNFVTQNNYVGKVIYKNSFLGKIYLTISNPIFILLLFSLLTMIYILTHRKLN